jgi:hypothetical protein
MVQSMFDSFPNSLSVSELSLSLPILNGNLNKNYRLPLERLYGRNILENHDSRKEELESGLRSSPGDVNSSPIPEAKDYYLKVRINIEF